MNVFEQAEGHVAAYIASMELGAAVWNAVYENAKCLGPIERSEIANKVGKVAIDSMREAMLAAPAGGDK